jgi:hypothetical protein
MRDMNKIDWVLISSIIEMRGYLFLKILLIRIFFPNFSQDNKVVTKTHLGTNKFNQLDNLVKIITLMLITNNRGNNI